MRLRRGCAGPPPQQPALEHRHDEIEQRRKCGEHQDAGKDRVDIERALYAIHESVACGDVVRAVVATAAKADKGDRSDGGAVEPTVQSRARLPRSNGIAHHGPAP